MKPWWVLALVYALLILATGLSGLRTSQPSERMLEDMQPALRQVAQLLPPSRTIDIYGSRTPDELLIWCRLQLAPRHVEARLLGPGKSSDTLLLLYARQEGPDSLIQSLRQQSALLGAWTDARYQYLLLCRLPATHATP